MHLRPFLSVSLCFLWWQGICLAADNGCEFKPDSTWPLKSEPRPAPEFVFRGDRRSPEMIRAAGGWLPWAVAERTPKAFGLLNHEMDIKSPKGQRDTVYVSTTTSFDVAARYARMNQKGRKDTYIYYIHATPNMVDLNLALGNETQFWWQREFSAMGGIRWSQVVGWVLIDESFFNTFGYGVPQCGAEDEDNGFFLQHLKSPRSEGFFSENPDYCRCRWAPFTASGWEPQLAGFAEYDGEFVARHRDRWYREVEPWRSAQGKTTQQHAYEFMERTKMATGWRGSFPLFRKEDPEAACPMYGKCPVVAA